MPSFKRANFKVRNQGRWLGFLLAIISVWVLSSAVIATQWMGWTLASLSCIIWVWYGYKDKDYPRMLMELFYLILAMRAIWNWIQ